MRPWLYLLPCQQGSCHLPAHLASGLLHSLMRASLLMQGCVCRSRRESRRSLSWNSVMTSEAG